MIKTKDNPKLVKNIFNFKRMNTFTGIVKDRKNNIGYYVNGSLHRENAPAVEFSHGDKEWYLNGKCHREDGSAVETAIGSKSWYLNGEYYGWNNDFTNESWIRMVNLELLK